MRRSAISIIGAALLITGCQSSTVYDLVIEGGRVIDPETGFDKTANIGIIDGVIAEITAAQIAGDSHINAAGMVAAPGFIDIHSHSPTPLGTKYQLLDGVTTQLDLEAGAFPVSAYGFAIKDKPLVNYGSSVSHLAVRAKIIEGTDKPYLFGPSGPLQPGAAFVQPATSDDIERMRGLLAQGMIEGGIGIGVLLDYISVAVSAEELRMIFDVAAKHKAPVTVHVRRGLPGDPAGLIEVIELAEETGVDLLVCHITHSAISGLPDWLARIDAANARGANIAAETLTYAAGGTSIGAAVFGRDWQSIFDITYEDVQWTATGEWLTKESFNRYRQEEPSGMVNHHYLSEELMQMALKWPRMMASSDVTPAITEDVLANPNLAGTFTRLIAHYSRDEQIMPLSEALAKTSLYQAQWLGNAVPALIKKGRMQKGMDADIVVFDLSTLKANAEYGDPYQAPTGMAYVIVGGEITAENGNLREGVTQGQHIKAGR